MENVTYSPAVEKLVYNSTEARKALGVSMPTFYDLTHRADFPVIRIGKKIVVPVDGLKKWLEKAGTGEGLNGTI